MDISERIKQRMSALELRAVDVVRLTGVSKGTVSQWLNGIAKPGGKNIIALSKALGCQPDWLLFGKDAPIQNTTPSNVIPGPDIKGEYPLISWVQAGAWAAIYEENLAESVRYPCPVACSDSTFVLRVLGISMQPTFNEGELIFVDPEAEIANGKYVVARLDDENEATFKQLVIEGERKFLKPANPNWPEQLIPINGNCTIVGVVVFAGRIF